MPPPPDPVSIRQPPWPDGGASTSAAPGPRPLPQGWSSPPPEDFGQDGSPGAWLLVWTIVAVKTVTIVVTVAIARSWDAGAVIAVTTWPWLLAVAALVAGPLLFRARLRRVRAKRARLLRAEWMLDPADGAPSRHGGTPRAEAGDR